MLLRQYTFTVALPECVPSAVRVNAIADLSQDIREVLPYINARVKAGIYNHEGGTLRFVHQGHAINLFPHRITVSGLRDREEAVQVLEWVKDFINTTWQNRQDIEPSFRREDEVKIIDVYRMLPGTNCGECGEPTCMAFAAKLARQEAESSECRPLLSHEWQEKRQLLFSFLQSTGHSIHEQEQIDVNADSDAKGMA
jgi:ArsR family metal-binding transcriptional regulator